MTFIQLVNVAKYPRMKITQKIGVDKIGFESGSKLFVSQKNDTILFSAGEIPEGFIPIKTAKVYTTSKREVVQLPEMWLNQSMKGERLMKVTYTKIGVFVKPYRKGEFHEINH